MKSLLMIATMVIGGVSNNNYSINRSAYYKEGNGTSVATELIIKNDNLPVTTYILNHMSDYNEARIAEGYSATTVSFVKSCPISTVDGELIEGQLVKFETGYVLAGQDNVIHAMSFINDVAFDLSNGGVNLQTICFYDVGGFYEYDTAIKDWKYLPKIEADASINAKKDGQLREGMGYIYDPDAYVLDAYGSKANFESARVITTDTGYTPLSPWAYDSSLYKKPHNDDFYYEPLPPFLVALVICDYIDKSYETIYYPRDAMVDYDVSTMDLKSYYDDLTNRGYIKTDRRRISTMEAELRALSFEYFETVDLAGASDSKILIQGFHVSGRSPYVMTIFPEKILGTYTSKLKEVLDKNNIGLIRFTSTDCYGNNFAAAITGYRTYKKVVSFIGLTAITTVWLLQLRDGLCDTITYFDATNGDNRGEMYFFDTHFQSE